MENRRLFSFLLVTFVFFWVWGNIVVPKLFPPPPAVPVPAEAEDPEQDRQPVAAQDADQQPAADLPLPDHPAVTTTLGSLDADSGYAMEVQLISSGASIDSVILADPQYRDLADPTKQARIIGNNFTQDRSFSMAVDLIDQQLAAHEKSLETVHWDVVEAAAPESSGAVTYSFTALDGSVRIEKTYSLSKRCTDASGAFVDLNSDPVAYTLNVTVRAINLSDDDVTLRYDLQGPVGVLLENEEHTSKYRDLKIEFLGEDDDVTVAAGTVADWVSEIRATGVVAKDKLRTQMQESHKWTGAFRYAGVDVQFFAALIAPIDSRTPEQRNASRWIDRTYPVLISADPVSDNRSDISFRMLSNPLVLAPAGGADTVEHQYAFFVGPKRKELLDPDPLVAARVLDYGWFGPVARVMHWLLSTFHSMGLPYALCIICLTVMVRGCLFPISRKQAISAAKMKELQPKIQELKVKFGDDREKLARAQMELWRKHKINPLAGCLPLFLQLPVFIGLYTALSSAVDLRLAGFLWSNNLAAPDALFRMPFDVPMLGRDFNLLPIITVALFMIQQKLFMPPAVDEQTAAQYKMMNIMTLMFGFMFWHQAAGLCVYFIASSVWGIAERKLLGTVSLAADTEAEVAGDSAKQAKVVVRKPGSKPADTSPPKPPGFLQRLVNAAKEAQDQAEKTRRQAQSGGNGKKKR